MQKQYRNLIHRYLVWCYKTTKESLDRIDRYYTQLQVDAFILQDLKKQRSSDKDYQKFLKDFENYMTKKKENVDLQKYKDEKSKELRPDYIYLKNRFLAIEKAIVHFLGKKELLAIEQLYEKEMITRILEAREHS